MSEFKKQAKTEYWQEFLYSLFGNERIGRVDDEHKLVVALAKKFEADVLPLLEQKTKKITDLEMKVRKKATEKGTKEFVETRRAAHVLELEGRLSKLQRKLQVYEMHTAKLATDKAKLRRRLSAIRKHVKEQSEDWHHSYETLGHSYKMFLAEAIGFIEELAVLLKEGKPQ